MHKTHTSAHEDRLSNDISRAESFFRSLFDGEAPTWSNVIFVENMLNYRKGNFYHVPQAALLTPDQYRPMFENRRRVCTWINFNAIGIFNDSFLINLEYPVSQRKHGMPDQVAVNLSGPCLKSAERKTPAPEGPTARVRDVGGFGSMTPEWDLTDKIVLL